MRNRFSSDDNEKRRILLLHEESTKQHYLNLIVEQEWLSFPGDKNYTYQKQNNKWVAKNKAGKVFDMSKYPSSVQRLEKQFPGGKAPAGAQSTTANTQSTTANTQTTTANTQTTTANTQTTTANTQTDQVNQEFSNAISTMLQKMGSQPNSQQGLGNEIKGVMQQFIQNPDTKAIVDRLTSSGVDIGKLPPAQIIPTLKQYDTAGVLKIDPKLTTPQVFGGPLIGTSVLNINGNYKWGDTVQYKFPGLVNRGKGQLVVVKFQGGSDNTTSDIKLPMTLEPNASTGPFTVNVKLVKGGTTTVPGPDGVVNYNVSSYLLTEKGQKNKYQLALRGNFKITD